MTAAPVTYGLHADAYLVAHAVNSALEGAGIRVMVDVTLGEAEVWILRRNEPTTAAVRFEPGQQLIVEHDGWRIEDAPVVAP